MTGPDAKANRAHWAAIAHLVLATGFVATSLYVLSVASWTTIAFDQWRIYDEYFSLPFPQDVLIAQNGHHPVLPGLLFLVDIYAFGAHNRLLNTLGVACAALFAALWSRIVWRDRELEPSLRAILVGSVWIATFWLANDRVLAHGNESLHVYPMLCGLLIAVGALGAYRPGRATGSGAGHRSWAPLGAAVLGCVIATFSFGLGLASWPIALGIAWIAGYSWRSIIALGAAATVVVGTYFFVLPAEDAPPDVPLHSQGIQPLEIVTDAAVWLGAPLYHALHPIDRLAVDPRIYVACGFVGGIGLLIAASALLVAVRRRGALTGLQIWTLALLALGVSGALLVAYGRGNYFDQLPQQRVAHRYLPWACTFWVAAGASLAIQAARLRERRRLATKLWMVVGLALPLGLLPSHRGQHLEFARYHIEEAGLGLALELRNEAIVQRLFRRRPVVVRLSEQLKSRDLAMFAGPVEEELGKKLPDLYRVLDPDDGIVGTPLGVEPLLDRRKPAARFWGRISGSTAEYDEVIVTDSIGRIVGRGIFRGRGHRWARKVKLLADIQPQYSGYIAGYRPHFAYAVYAASRDERKSVRIATGVRPPESTADEATR